MARDLSDFGTPSEFGEFLSDATRLSQFTYAVKDLGQQGYSRGLAIVSCLLYFFRTVEPLKLKPVFARHCMLGTIVRARAKVEVEVLTWSTALRNACRSLRYDSFSSSVFKVAQWAVIWSISPRKLIKLQCSAGS